MPIDPATVVPSVSALLSAFSVLYAVLKRSYDVENDTLKLRRENAITLHAACALWGGLLEAVFKDIERKSKKGDYAGARKVLEALMKDFRKLDYESLAAKSPIIVAMSQHKKFRPFALACAEFYATAMDLKAVTYDELESKKNKKVRLSANGPKAVFDAWRPRLEAVTLKVNDEYQRIAGLAPK